MSNTGSKGTSADVNMGIEHVDVPVNESLHIFITWRGRTLIVELVLGSECLHPG